MAEGLVVTRIGRLTTNGSDRRGDPAVVADAAVVIRDGAVAWIGTAAALPAGNGDLPVLDCDGRAVVPGFVDAHTHLVFAGDRSGEFGRRLAGERYGDILAAGGGILATVDATRAASDEALAEAARARADRMLRTGTTTVEIKSGYGLDTATEVRMLEVAAALDASHPIDVVATFLGAHAVPVEYAGDRAGYVDLVVDEMLPACAPLAAGCDVFCDEGAFTVDEARRVLEAGRAHDLVPRIHAEQLSRTGAARLAVEVGAASADHLDHATAADAAALAAAGTAAVLVPAASFSLRTEPAPARMLWDAGVTVALATDCNPGTSYVESMPFVVALGVIEMGLTPDEAVWAATRGGALALGLPDRGRLVPGAAGDLVVLDAPSHDHLPYRPGTDLVHAVVKAGAVVA
jgi:imidazolonepropionase